MSRKSEVMFLLFTCFVFACLAIKPEWLTFVVLRAPEEPGQNVLRAIRIGAIVFGTSALLTLLF